MGEREKKTKQTNQVVGMDVVFDERWNQIGLNGKNDTHTHTRKQSKTADKRSGKWKRKIKGRKRRRRNISFNSLSQLVVSCFLFCLQISYLAVYWRVCRFNKNEKLGPFHQNWPGVCSTKHFTSRARATIIQVSVFSVHHARYALDYVTISLNTQWIQSSRIVRNVRPLNASHRNESIHTWRWFEHKWVFHLVFTSRSQNPSNALILFIRIIALSLSIALCFRTFLHLHSRFDLQSNTDQNLVQRSYLDVVVFFRFGSFSVYVSVSIVD